MKSHDKTAKTIPLSEEMIAELKFHQDRSGVSIYRLLKYDDAPENLPQSNLYNWLAGRVKTVNPTLYSFVLEKWKSFPDNKIEYVDIDQKIIDRLRFYQDKTGLGPSAILRGCRYEMPIGLQSDIVIKWMTGKMKKVNTAYLEYILHRWEYLLQRNLIMVPIDKVFIDAMRAHRERTGVSSPKLFRDWTDAPEGLTINVMNSWFRGSTVTAQTGYLEAALKRWESLPDKQAEAVSKKKAELKDIIPYVWADHDYTPMQEIERVPMTNELRERFLAYRNAGITASIIMKNTINKPEGINVYNVSAAMRGQGKTIRKEWLDFIIKNCEAISKN